MSYVRWSSDSHRSDVYVYADVSGGYTLMVASVRYVGEEPRPELPPLSYDNIIEYLKADERLSKWLESATLQPISLAYAGETFNCETAEEMADKLIDLRKVGYHVPQHAIDNLLAEKN